MPEEAIETMPPHAPDILNGWPNSFLVELLRVVLIQIEPPQSPFVSSPSTSLGINFGQKAEVETQRTVSRLRSTRTGG